MLEKHCRTAQNWNLRGECLTIPTLTLYVTKPQAFRAHFDVHVTPNTLLFLEVIW